MSWGGLLLGAVGLLLVLVAARGSYANLGRYLTGQKLGTGTSGGTAGGKA